METVEISPIIQDDDLELGCYLFALLLKEEDQKYKRISCITSCRSHLTDCMHFLFEREDIKDYWKKGSYSIGDAAGILLNKGTEAYDIKDAKDRISLLFYPGLTKEKDISRFEAQFVYYIHKIEERNGFKKTEIYKTIIGTAYEEEDEDGEYEDVDMSAYVLVPDPRWYADTILFSIYTFIVKSMKYDLEGRVDFWNSENINDRKDKKLTHILYWDGSVASAGQAAIWFPYIFNNLNKFSEGERHILGFPAEKDRDQRWCIPFSIHGLFNFYEMLEYINLPPHQQEYISYMNLKKSTFFYNIITEAKVKGLEKEYNMNFIKE